MKTTLSLIDVEGLPYEPGAVKTKTTLPIPAVSFTDAAPSLKKIFKKNITIYTTPYNFFMTKLRNIHVFQHTKLRHTSATESKHWLGTLATTTQICCLLHHRRL